MIRNGVFGVSSAYALLRAQNMVAVAAALMLLASGSLSAAGLRPDKNEKARLKACERRLCSIIVGRKPRGPDLACRLSKTWSKKLLKKGGRKSRVAWLFGDARCETDVVLRRVMILGALSGRKYKMKMPLHTVNCTVERSNELRPVRILIAPKIKFKHGKAKKIWLNVRKVHAPSDVKGLIWTVAKLEDSLGIFHRSMIKQVNKFIHKQCFKVLQQPRKNIVRKKK